MLYLEDYLEMIEHLPQHFRDTLTQMRELDLQVNNDMDSWEARVKKFFSSAHLLPVDTRDAQFSQLKQEHQKALEAAEDKVTTASHLFELVDKYLRKLEQELLKFKMELEADNAGITEILEKRSLELDNPPTSTSNHSREKRKLGFANQNDQKLNSAPSEKGLHSYPQENNFATINNFASSKNQNNVQQGSQGNSFGLSDHPFALFNSKVSNDKSSLVSKLKVNLPPGTSVIAAAASQAIAATQQMNLGRRTASLKASYEAINSGSGFSGFNFTTLRLDDSDSNAHNFLRQSTSELNDFEQANKKSRMNNKRSRTSSQYNQLELSNSTSSDAIGDTWTGESEPRYCFCHNVSYGEMIYCENKQCPFGQWFHYECVGINKPPKGSWFCSTCLKDIKNDKKEKKKKEKALFTV